MTVNNVAPTVTLAAGNDLSVNEGTTHTYGFTVTDPGQDTFSVVAVELRRQRHARSDDDHDGFGWQFRLHVPRRSGLEHRVGSGQGFRQRQ